MPRTGTCLVWILAGLWAFLPLSCGTEEGFDPFSDGGFFEAPDGAAADALGPEEPVARVADAHDDPSIDPSIEPSIEPVGELPADAPPEVEPVPCTLDLQGCYEEHEGTPTVELCPPPRNVCGRDNVNACCPPGYAPIMCIDCGHGENHGVDNIYDPDGTWVGCNGWEGENNYGSECARVVCTRENCEPNEICDNGLDDDGDGLTDCRDVGNCGGDPVCAEGDGFDG